MIKLSVKNYGELLLATFFWGFGFVTTVWCLTAVSPLWLTAIRFLVAFLLLDLCCRFRLFGLEPIRYLKREWKAVFAPSLCLFALLALQTWGLKYTTATKSGFITVLYVLFVPIFERIFLGVRFRKILLLWILLALIGSALICQVSTFDTFNFGDILTLLCAMAAAAQFIFINQKYREVNSPVKFHLYQCGWTATLSILFAIPLEKPDFLQQEWSTLAWIGMAQLVIFSSCLAFLIQIRVQRKIPTTTVAIFMLLESPWAMLSSVFFLKEQLSGTQVLGAALILTAALAETLTVGYFARRAVSHSS